MDPVDLALARRLADCAQVIARRHLASQALAVEQKNDGSPVTDADREIEQALRAVIHRERPGDAFLGEENGAHGESHRRWIVDAIDGTASFVADEPEWSTLIALEEDGRIQLGMVSAPALRRRWWAVRGSGSWVDPLPEDTAGPPREIMITGATRLHRAKVGIWPPPWRLTEAERAVAASFAASAGETRPILNWAVEQPGGPPPRKPSSGSGTCHGALLVAMGHLDAFLLLGAGLWDIAALVPIIEEAGGKVSSLSGSLPTGREAALFSNAELHQQILDVVTPCAF